MLKEPETTSLIAQLFDNQPDSVVWFRPIFENGSANVIDFEAQYANQTAARILNVAHSQIAGTRLRSTSLMDEDSVRLIFTQCLDVWNSGEPLEYTYYSPGFDRYFNVQRSRVEDGVLSITRDRTKEVKTDIERQEQEKLYQQILDTAADGILLLKALRDVEGEIIDFRIAHCNKRGFESGQLPADAVGQTLLAVFPHLRNSPQFDYHKDVVKTGEEVRFETTFRTKSGTEFGWFIVSLTKLGDGVISNFVDISEKKAFEQALIDKTNLLNNILDASLSAVYTCDAVRDERGEVVDLRFVQVNQRFKELSVRPGLDVIGKNLLEEFPATRNTVTMEKLLQVIETGVPQRFEVHYQSDSDEEWYDTSAVKMGENGVVVTFENITELKRTVFELQQQKTLVEKILANSASGIAFGSIIRDETGKIVDGRTILANDAALRFAGIPRELFLTKSATELEPNIRESLYFQKIVQTMETGEPSSVQYRVETSGKWIEIALARMDDDHLIIVYSDITESKEAQLRQEHLLEELRRSNESLEEFTSVASHDLKEPIRKIHYFTERLKEKLQDRISEEEQGLLEKVETATGRMRHLVDDLLEYAHVGHSNGELEEVNLNSKLDLILTDLELFVTEKKASIEIGDLPVVRGYRRQLQQLFQNLVSNALKYSKPNVPPLLKITSRVVSGEGSSVAVRPEDQSRLFYRIEVSDNGIGFEQQYADKIFHIFTRLHGNSEYTGTGVGLAIVKKVVDNHHGYITAQSTPGSGATFTVLLPV